MKTLYPEQRVSVDSLKQSILKWGGALDSSETGTGKTLKAVELSRELGLMPLVVCPKSVIPAWERTFAEQNASFLGVINYEKIKMGKTQFLKKSGKGFFWNLPENSMLIFDEVHRCKAAYSQNSKMLSAAHRIPTLMLSATAAENPSEMRSIGCILRLHSLTDYIKWALKYGCQFNPWNALEFDPLEGPAKLELLNKVIYPDRGHKLTRKDLGSHFKETSVCYDPIDFGDKGKIKKILSEVETEINALFNKQEVDRLKAEENDTEVMAITKLLRARQKVELLKVPMIAEMIEDYLDLGHSVAVFLNFNDSLDALARLVKIPHGVIRGGQSDSSRQKAIDDFQADYTRLIIANLSAGGVGVSLHDVNGSYSRVALISPSYSAKDLQQALGRVDRAGAKTDSIQRILTAADTIEEEILAKLRLKLRNLDIMHGFDAKIATPTPKQPVQPANSSTNTEHMSTNLEQSCEKPQEPDQHTGPAPAHAEFSPSQLKHFRACSGYTPTQSTSDAAESGTRIHEALEIDDMSKLTDFEAYVAGLCNDGVNKILSRAQFDPHDPAVRDIREIRLTVHCGDEETFGTCDRLFVKGDIGIAMDYKTGVGKIDDAEDNMQAKAYSVGIFQMFPDINKLEFWFIVPRRDELLFAEFTRDNIDEFQQEIADTIRAARRAKRAWTDGSISINQLSASPDNCRWCANAYKCPAVANSAIRVAKSYSGELEVPDLVHGSEIDDPVLIAKLLKVAPILEKCIAGWKNRAREMVFEQGLDVPGYERAERAGVRKITDPIKAWNQVSGFMSIEQFLSALGDISAAKFEDIVGATAERGKKKALVSKVMADLFSEGAVSMSNPSQFLKATHE